MADKPFVKTMTDYMICEKKLTAADEDKKASCPICKKFGLWYKQEKGASRNKHVKSYVLCPTCHYAEYERFGLGNEDEKRIFFDYETGKYRKK